MIFHISKKKKRLYKKFMLLVVVASFFLLKLLLLFYRGGGRWRKGQTNTTWHKKRIQTRWKRKTYRCINRLLLRHRLCFIYWWFSNPYWYRFNFVIQISHWISVSRSRYSQLPSMDTILLTSHVSNELSLLVHSTNTLHGIIPTKQSTIRIRTKSKTKPKIRLRIRQRHVR